MKLNRIAASLTSAAALTLVAGSANATVVNVGGVTWDTSSGFDFSGQVSIYQTTTFLIGDTISGIGVINQLNGTGSSVFCPGCELTFEFGGYSLLDNNPTDYSPAPGIDGAQYGISPPSFSPFTLGEFLFTGGWLKLYVNSTPNFSPDNVASAIDGLLWLDLLAVDESGNNGGVTLQGDLTRLFSDGLAGQGTGFFDAIGGLAKSNLDTNTQTGGRDLSYSSSFQPIPNSYVTPDGLTHLGTSEWVGKSTPVPEPSVLALLGVGLIGLGAARRLKKGA